eukprot:GAHX01003604.1.p1 GENE.GAHX01003604.1~~GAHX01003604.1.p1  ORF type:complete len:64 (+),score=3.88 GAHX01003604.1:226-417(+)
MMTKFKDLKSTQLENIKAFDIHCTRTDISHFITSVLLQKNLYHRINCLGCGWFYYFKLYYVKF